MLVKEVMSTNLSTVAPSDSVAAAEIMKNRQVGCVPVCDQKQLCGLLTDRDLVIRAMTGWGAVRQMTVGEVMSYHPIVAEPQMSVEEAAYLMKQQQIRRLPVVENNQLVGMLSLGALATLSDGLQSIEALKHISQP